MHTYICTYVLPLCIGSDDGKELVHAHTYVRMCCLCVLVVMMGKS